MNERMPIPVHRHSEGFGQRDGKSMLPAGEDTLKKKCRIRKAFRLPTYPTIRFSGEVPAGEILRQYGGLAGRIGLVGASPSLQLMLNQNYCRIAESREPAEALRFADDAVYDGETLWFCIHWSGWLGEAYSMVWAEMHCDRISRILRQAGHQAEPIHPLSAALSLPRAAARAGLGNLSPYGLLVHKVFGPRILLGGLRTDYTFEVKSQWPGGGCDGCGECLRVCPQHPEATGEIHLPACARCAKCVEACPVGKPVSERGIGEVPDQP
jgi:ferredoxin